MKKLLLIMGDLATGKSVFADILSKRYNVNVFYKDSIKEVLGDTIGFDDYFNKNAVCIIEWSDMICDCLPEERLQIDFKIIDENTRVLVLKPYGEKYEDLVNSVL